MSIKEQLLKEIKNILDNEDIKNEFKIIMKPFFGIILSELYPYIFLCLVIVILCFIILITILFLLIRYVKIYKAHCKQK